jgi:hypothetical protein
MKKLLNISALLLATAFFVGCDKETEPVAKWSNTSGAQAFLKINFNSAYTANPSVQLKLNETRVSNLITARQPFPGSGFNTIGAASQNDYLAVNPGATALTVSIPNRNTVNDSVVLFTSSLNLEAGKRYTAHITDTATKTKMVLLVDDITRPDTGKTRYRFVNLMPNVPAADLYYGTALVASNIPYLGNSNYIDIPRPASGLSWSIRETGTSASSTALATYTSASVILDQRVYTAFAVGYKGATDAVRKPYISFIVNN